MEPKILVVCYSRDGATEIVARRIAEALEADLDVIGEPTARAGVLGYLRSAIEAVARGVPTITTRKNPRDYDLVVVGTPVWVGTMSSPVRSYLLAHAGEFRNAAFFAVMGGRGGDETVREMHLASRVFSALSYTFTRHEVVNEHYLGRCAQFIRGLKEVAQRTERVDDGRARSARIAAAGTVKFSLQRNAGAEAHGVPGRRSLAFALPLSSLSAVREGSEGSHEPRSASPLRHLHSLSARPRRR